MKRLAKQALLALAAIIALAILLTVFGCSKTPEPALLPIAEQPIAPVPPETSTAAATVEPDPVPEIPDEPIVERPRPLLTDEGLKLLVDLEVGGRRAYERLYPMPIWPGGASGVTIGIGYDLGHASAETIRLDWAQHAQVDRLAAASGITGAAARALVPSLRDITTPFELAQIVFLQSMVPKYHNIARRSFGGRMFDALMPFARDALISLVFNRGGAMGGSSRVEMRHIRDVCVPVSDSGCIAGQLIAMIRVWHGSSIEGGMRTRRTAEAKHAERKA